MKITPHAISLTHDILIFPPSSIFNYNLVRFVIKCWYFCTIKMVKCADNSIILNQLGPTKTTTDLSLIAMLIIWV